MAQSLWVGDVRTGRRITQIPVAGANWSMAHRTDGDITAQIHLGAREFARYERAIAIVGLPPGPFLYPSPTLYPAADVPAWTPGRGMRDEFFSAIDPARCFAAIVDGDNVVVAGPIWTHSRPRTSQVLTIRAAGIGSIFDHRRVMGIVADGLAAAGWKQVYDGISLATIAKRLIALTMAHTHGELPIDLPDDETIPVDADHTRTYNGYDLGTVGQRLDELMNVEGGPDLALEPYITPDRMGIRWRLRAGTTADPLLHQAGPEWIFDATTPQSTVGGIGVEVTALGMASRAWATGEGSQEALLMEWADDDAMTSLGYPLMEDVEAHPTVSERTTAASWARANVGAQVRPWATWTMDVKASSLTRNGTLIRPGDFLKVWIPASDPYLRRRAVDGYHKARLLSVDGSLGGATVTLTMAPAMEGR